MRKHNTSLVVFMMVTFIFLNGCATDKPFAKSDNRLTSPIKVIRYETPGILRSTMTETFFLTAAVALPGGSALLILGDEYAKAKGADMQMKIPDFGYIVMDKFVERLKKEGSDWPALTVEKKPVGEDFAESCYLIEFKVNRLAYGYLDIVRGGGNGFFSNTVVTMKDPGGEVLWQKSFTYQSKDFERDKNIDDFEANDGKLLRDEIEFAAEKTVLEFIKHLKGEEADIYAKQ
jgi:hypothetical protein